MLRLVDRVLAWVGWGLAALVVALLIAGPGLIGADNGAPVAPASYSGAGKGAAAGNGGAAGNARALFISNCGSCHTLAAAGTSGAVGPNLDDAKPNAALVREIVTSGSGSMPSFQGRLDAAQVRALADYVASTAGG
jgi:mono/diheme cytochrome c family protein